MSPVFRHGRLRLYLLKLLDEAPRHGYEVIRLLQDRFLGVYAPSPGTIYPRLARLEEEGLVTHDESDGKKVYRLTDKGRAELHARYEDLAELEEEITASVRDIAQEVSEDVRATVRSLREELTSAARGMRSGPRPGRPGTGQSGAGRPGTGRPEPGRPGQEDVWGEASARDQARQEAQEQRERARAEREEARTRRQETQERRQRERRERDTGHGPGWGRAGEEEDSGEPGSGWGRQDWGDWGDWQEWAGWARHRGQAGQPWGDPYRDMERLARQFTREFHRAAGQAQAIGEEAVATVREILEDAMERIRTEVFTSHGGGPPSGSGPAGGQGAGDQGAEGGPAESGAAEGGPAESGPAESGPAESGPAESGAAEGGPAEGDAGGSGPAKDGPDAPAGPHP